MTQADLPLVPPIVAITAALMAAIEGIEALVALLEQPLGERGVRLVAEKTFEARQLMQWMDDE